MSFAVSQNILRRSNRWKLIGLLSLLAAIFIVLVTVENLLMSSILALMISYSLGPLVNYLERQGIGRTLGVGPVEWRHEAPGYCDHDFAQAYRCPAAASIAAASILLDGPEARVQKSLRLSASSRPGAGNANALGSG